MYTIGTARCFVAGKEWKIDNVEVKIIKFIIKHGRKSTSILYHKCQIKVI